MPPVCPDCLPLASSVPETSTSLLPVFCTALLRQGFVGQVAALGVDEYLAVLLGHGRRFDFARHANQVLTIWLPAAAVSATLPPAALIVPALMTFAAGRYSPPSPWSR